MARSSRERWVVLSNCQSHGLARAISAVTDSVNCEACDAWQMADRLAEDPDHFLQYDFALILPSLRDHPDFPRRLPSNVAEVPFFQFSGYHPDCCFVSADRKVIFDGFAGPYHSMIALAGYKEQIGPVATARYFNDRFFERAGYYDQWEAQRDAMIELFAQYGWEIGGIFRRASRGRSFMHAIDHPDIVLMMELAKVIVHRFGHRFHDEVPAPLDSLAGVSWPVYPEVGERLGVPGSYQFRSAGLYNAIGLDHYLEIVFGSFSRWDRSLLRVGRPIEPRLQHIRRLIREEL